MNTEKKPKKTFKSSLFTIYGELFCLFTWCIVLRLIYYPFPDRNRKLQQTGPLNALETQSAYSSAFPSRGNSRLPHLVKILVNWYDLPLLWIPVVSLHLLRHLAHSASHEELLLVYVSNLLCKTKIVSYSNLYLLAGKERVFYLPHTIRGDIQ